MKNCIMMIASPFEKDYVDEWATWHHDICGFDEVFVMANNWSLEPTRPYMKVVEMPGEKMQLPAYNCFGQTQMSSEYGWVMVMDGDEFLWLPDGKKIGDYFDEASRIGVPQVSFQWMLFGSGGEGVPTSGSVLSRFKRASGVFKMEVKSALNLEWCRKNNVVPYWVNPHFACGAYGDGIKWLHSIHYPSRQIMWGPTRKDLEGTKVQKDVPFIAHYFTKTKVEWNARRSIPRPDNNQLRNPSEFDEEDHNEVECDWLA